MQHFMNEKCTVVFDEFLFKHFLNISVMLHKKQSERSENAIKESDMQ